MTDQDGASDPARRREQIAKEAAETPRLVEAGQLDVAVSRILRRLPKVMDRLGS